MALQGVEKGGGAELTLFAVACVVGTMDISISAACDGAGWLSGEVGHAQQTGMRNKLGTWNPPKKGGKVGLVTEQATTM